jgi:hypothetical protein
LAREGDIPAGEAFDAAVMSNTKIQRAGGNLIMSLVISNVLKNSHGLENQNNELVVDPLFSMKDTIP